MMINNNYIFDLIGSSFIVFFSFLLIYTCKGFLQAYIALAFGDSTAQIDWITEHSLYIFLFIFCCPVISDIILGGIETLSMTIKNVMLLAFS